MIDDPLQVSLLEILLNEAVPIQARMTARLIAALAKNEPGLKLVPDCTINEILYAGDQGGFMCVLGFDAIETTHGFVSSLTHLSIDPRHPLARDIASYQRRRIKRLKRLDREPWRSAA